MLYNKFRTILLVGLLGILSGCSRSGSSSPIYDAFVTFGTTVSSLILNTYVVLGFMFFAMLIGTFAMFKGLLRFSFSKGFGESTFGQKEINVIALMLSVIGTTGIFFIFRTDAPGLISLFGGSVGLLFVLFICTLIMQYFLNFAKSFENPEGPLGKGAGWIFIVSLGSIFSLFLLIGYAGKVLNSLGCSIADSTKEMTCRTIGDYNIFLVIYNNGSTILSWLVFIALIFGVMSLMKKKGGEEEIAPVISNSSSPSNDGFFGKVFGGSKNKEKSADDKEFDKQVNDMKGHVDLMKRGLSEVVKSINNQKEILSKVHKKFGDLDNKGGKN
jgi:hypothetical protein